MQPNQLESVPNTQRTVLALSQDQSAFKNRPNLKHGTEMRHEVKQGPPSDQVPDYHNAINITADEDGKVRLDANH